MKQQKKPQITFISVHNPEDVSTWSGINYYLLQALKRHFEVEVITNFPFRHTLGLKLGYWFSSKLGHQFLYELTNDVCRQTGRELSPRIHPDSLFVFTVNSHVLPYLRTQKPIFLFQDATLKLLDGQYDFATNLHPLHKCIAHRLARKAYSKCRHIYLSSQWAADSVVHHYNQPESKVSVWPFGANFSSIPSTQEVMSAIFQRSKDVIRLLWVGVDRKRKGADTAIAIATELHNKGINIQLDLVGIANDPGEQLPPYIHCWGKLQKSIPDDESILCDLFRKAHFFIFPTLADCSPVVISEAAAFGIPVLTSNIAGIPSVVEDGETGYLLPANPSPDAYTLLMEQLICNWNQYIKMAQASRRFYDTHLCWAVNAERFANRVLQENWY